MGDEDDHESEQESDRGLQLWLRLPGKLRLRAPVHLPATPELMRRGYFGPASGGAGYIRDMTSTAPTPATINVLVENHRRFLQFLERRVGSREVAEDILQDAFV